MNSAELKLDLFRRLDSLDSSRLEMVYSKIVKLISTENPKGQSLPTEIKTALDLALEASKQGKVHTHDAAMHKTKEKYPNLFK